MRPSALPIATVMILRSVPPNVSAPGGWCWLQIQRGWIIAGADLISIKSDTLLLLSSDNWQRDAYLCPLADNRENFDGTTVRLKDTPRQRQTHTHALLLVSIAVKLAE